MENFKKSWYVKKKMHRWLVRTIYDFSLWLKNLLSYIFAHNAVSIKRLREEEVKNSIPRRNIWVELVSWLCILAVRWVSDLCTLPYVTFQRTRFLAKIGFFKSFFQFLFRILSIKNPYNFQKIIVGDMAGIVSLCCCVKDPWLKNMLL